MAGNDCSIRIGLFSPVIEQCPGQAPRVIEVGREEAAALSFFLKQTLKEELGRLLKGDGAQTRREILQKE